MNHLLSTLLFLSLLFSCQSPTPEQEPVEPVEEGQILPQELSAADKIIAETVEAHGGDGYDAANYSFVFRDNTYTFRNDGSDFRYSVTSIKDGVTVVDVLDNGELTHTLDGLAVELSEKNVAKFTEALNSVIYFATLPHKLRDPAVNPSLTDGVSVNGVPYHSLVVQFREEGGGTDHDDNFRYWINKNTKRVDFLAYDYRTNGGGVRFRSAYNPREVGGILFQDYVNYKAPLGTDLDSLPAMFERGELEELSRIETEEVTNLTK